MSEVEIDEIMLKEELVRLGETIGLGIFGVDILKRETDNKYFLIDMNYFSSFKGVPQKEVTEAMQNYLIKISSYLDY